MRYRHAVSAQWGVSTFNSGVINNSTSTFQNYWLGHNCPLQLSPNSACAAVLVSFI
jgi:hypothetical protein